MRQIVLGIGLLLVLGGIIAFLFLFHSETPKIRIGIILLQPTSVSQDLSDITRTLADFLNEHYHQQKPALELHLSAASISTVLIDSVAAPQGLEPADAWKRRLQQTIDRLWNAFHSETQTPLVTATALTHTMQLLNVWLRRQPAYDQILIVGTLDPCIRPGELQHIAAKDQDTLSSGENIPRITLLLSGNHEAIAALNQLIQRYAPVEDRSIPTPPLPCPSDTTVVYHTGIFLFSPVDSAKAACYITTIFRNIPDTAWLHGVQFSVFTNSAHQPWRSTWYDSAQTRSKLQELLTLADPVTEIRRLRFILQRMQDFCTIATPVDLYFLGSFPDIARKLRGTPLLRKPPQCLSSIPNLQVHFDLSPKRYREAFQNLFTYLQVNFFTVKCPEPQPNVQ